MQFWETVTSALKPKHEMHLFPCYCWLGLENYVVLSYTGNKLYRFNTHRRMLIYLVDSLSHFFVDTFPWKLFTVTNLPLFSSMAISFIKQSSIQLAGNFDSLFHSLYWKFYCCNLQGRRGLPHLYLLLHPLINDCLSYFSRQGRSSCIMPLFVRSFLFFNSRHK